MGTFYLLRIELMHSRPRIWRRLFVPAAISLSHLHAVIQVAMGWHGQSRCHWQFVIRRHTYRNSEPAESRESAHADILLSRLIQHRGTTFQYTCYFEDEWEHRITLSNPDFDASAYTAAICCVAGESACPPRNIGGIEGYYRFLLAIGDPEHPDHDDMVDWIGEDFDRDAFYLDQINDDLERLQL